MKANDIFILLGTLVYSILFYEQDQGLNFLLFNVILVALFYLTNKSAAKKLSWLAVASGSLISAFFVFWWGTNLPVLANICSLSILAGLSFNPESSILVASFNTGVSVVTSIPRFFTQSASARVSDSGFFKKLLLFIIPAIISFAFVLVYRSANPIFKQFTDQINLDFISLSWCLFTLMAFFIMVGCFRYYPIAQINEADKKAPDNLETITLEEHLLRTTGGLSVSNEVLGGTVLLVMLNIILFCVNGLDVFYMWIVSKLPQGITLVAYVHDGANTLIFSIVMAISILLFVFRGYLNFYEKSQWLKALAYLWIAQNALLVITTANRNWWLVEQSGLTRRRTGVYIYLFLCLIGLFTTFLKVLQKKSNWFLFRKNGWAFYAVFIIACFINWDLLIVNYNCKNGNDRYYQSSLSNTSLEALFKAWSIERKEANKPNPEFSSIAIHDMYLNYEALKYEVTTSGWQSYCVSRRQTLDEINTMIKNGEVPAQ